MAKKVVATLKTGEGGEGKEYVKCIKMVRSPKTGAYIFKEAIVHPDHTKDYFIEK